MMAKEDGGTAFPTAVWIGDRGKTEGGLTLRDYFAGQALAGLSANPHFDTDVKTMAEWAWEQADAMLTARNTGEESDDA